MSRLSISVSHRLPQDEALRRVKLLLDRTRSEFADKISELEERWNGPKGTFSMRVAGFKVSGALEVGKDSVHVTGDLPLLASPFKGKIESVLRQQASTLFA